MNFLYLSLLLASFGCIIMIDKRWSLAWFRDATTTGVSVLIGVAVFILWDILGIWQGIFFSGHSPYMSGLYIGPEFPIEELVFLTFLCYFTLVLYRFFEERRCRM